MLEAALGTAVLADKGYDSNKTANTIRRGPSRGQLDRVPADRRVRTRESAR